MKIAIVITSLEVGGAEKIVLELIKRIKNKVEVRLYIIKKNYQSIYDEELKKLNIQYYYLNARSKIFSIFAAKRLKNLLDSFQPDIVHTHLKAADYIYYYYLKNKDIAWVHTAHTLASVDTKRIRRIFFKRLYKRGIIKVVAVSKTVANSLYLLYGIEAELIYNGIDLSNFQYQKKENKSFEIIHIGRFVPVKNHSYLIEEFAKLASVKPKVKLNLIGDGPTKPKITKRVKKLGISKYVKFISSTNEIQNHLQKASVFVLPSDYEGFSLSLLEAMASGLVCVVNRAIEEPIEEEANGFKFSLEENALFYCLQDIIDNYPSLERIRESAYNSVLAFSIDTMAKEYLRFYEKTAND